MESLILLSLLLIQQTLVVTSTVIFNNCTGEKLEECAKNQRCNDDKDRCECLSGFVINQQAESPDNACIEKSQVPTLPPVTEGGSWTVTILVIFTLSLLLTAGVLIIRRYDLITWARQKWEARRNTSVMYEDVMIGQDDPPISA